LILFQGFKIKEKLIKFLYEPLNRQRCNRDYQTTPTPGEGLAGRTESLPKAMDHFNKHAPEANQRIRI
jgi:hypothetical protein